MTRRAILSSARDFGLCAVLSLALAAPARASAIDELRSFLTQTSSARGDFTQQVTSRAGNARARAPSTGTFVFQRPGRFRWIYATPYAQTIVADGKTLWMHDQDLNQVTIKKLAATLPASPASILFGSNDFERDFEVTDDGTRDGLQWITARPRSKDSTFTAIRIGFRNGLPGAMVLEDSFGQTSTLRFDKVERNPKIAADTFTFTVPKGADVLEDR